MPVFALTTEGTAAVDCLPDTELLLEIFESDDGDNKKLSSVRGGIA
jgi:hypothetical protein